MWRRQRALLPVAALVILLTDASSAFVDSLYKRPAFRLGVFPQVGVGVIQGSDPDRPHKVCQDACFVEKIDNAWVCWGVMDGHGQNGHLLTCFLKEEIPKILRQELLSNTHGNEQELQEFQERLIALGKAAPLTNTTHIERVLIRTFHRAQLHAMQANGVPAGRSGCTCIVCLFHVGSRELYVASVGDSRAIFWSDSGYVYSLTQENTIALVEERARIQQCEGRVDAIGNIWYGPVGIAMTRALGDAVMLRAGVLPTPVIASYELPQKCTIVVATDGVFDVLTNAQVKEIVGVALHVDVQHAACALVEEAKRSWMGDLPIEGKVDDITCVVVQC